MLNMIAQTQLQSGYPYLMFKDVTKFMPIQILVNAEIFQQVQIKRDISCNLGSLIVN